MTFENDNYKLCLPHVFPPSFITASYGRALKTAISKISPNDQLCFTGDLKDKRNKVIPLEENPTTTTATLAPMNDELETMLNLSALPQLEDRHSSYSDVGLSGFSGCKLPSPHPLLFYAVSPKLHKARIRLFIRLQSHCSKDPTELH